MVKKIVIGILVFIIVFVGIIGLFVYNSFGPNSDLTLSNNFAKIASIEIFQNRNYDFLLKNSTSIALEEFEKDKSRKMFSDLNKYFGGVDSISAPITELKSSMNAEKGSEKTAFSYMDIKFENGKGRIYLTLMEQEKQWKIHNVNFKEAKE